MRLRKPEAWVRDVLGSQPRSRIASSTQATLCSASTSSGASGGDDDDDGRGGRQERGAADVGGRGRVQAGSANLPW